MGCSASSRRLAAASGGGAQPRSPGGGAARAPGGGGGKLARGASFSGAVLRGDAPPAAAEAKRGRRARGRRSSPAKLGSVGSSRSRTPLRASPPSPPRRGAAPPPAGDEEMARKLPVDAVRRRARPPKQKQKARTGAAGGRRRAAKKAPADAAGQAPAAADLAAQRRSRDSGESGAAATPGETTLLGPATSGSFSRSAAGSSSALGPSALLLRSTSPLRSALRSPATEKSAADAARPLRRVRIRSKADVISLAQKKQRQKRHKSPEQQTEKTFVPVLDQDQGVHDITPSQSMSSLLTSESDLSDAGTQPLAHMTDDDTYETTRRQTPSHLHPPLLYNKKAGASQESAEDILSRALGNISPALSPALSGIPTPNGGDLSPTAAVPVVLQVPAATPSSERTGTDPQSLRRTPVSVELADVPDGAVPPAAATALGGGAQQSLESSVTTKPQEG